MRAAPIMVGLLLLQASVALAEKPASIDAGRQPAKPVALPEGEGGIGFDDLGYSHAMGKLLVPAGRTGRLNLVDPASGGLVSIPGFSATKEFSGGHDVGVTSATDGAGLLFATDRTSRQLSIVYYPARRIVGQVTLSATPGYVRWVETQREIWVTEPDSGRIEIFHLEPSRPPSLTFVTRVVVPGGPGWLTVDPARGRAYTHVGDGKTAVIDLRTRAIIATFSHGCGKAKGVVLDGARGFLFVACDEGAVTTLDAVTGRTLGTIKVGAGLDIIAYSPESGHAYVPSRETEAIAILDVSKDGQLKLLGTIPGTSDPRCVAAAGKVFYADPRNGRLMMLADPYPPARR